MLGEIAAGLKGICSSALKLRSLGDHLKVVVIVYDARPGVGGAFGIDGELNVTELRGTLDRALDGLRARDAPVQVGGGGVGGGGAAGGVGTGQGGRG